MRRLGFVLCVWVSVCSSGSAQGLLPTSSSEEALADLITLLSAPEKIYWIQAENFNSVPDAEQLARTLEGSGFGPVSVMPLVGSQESCFVRIGPTGIYMDAFVAWESVRHHCPGARIRYRTVASEAGQHRDEALQPINGPGETLELFCQSQRPLRSKETVQFDSDACALGDGGLLEPSRARADGPELEAAALQVLASVPNTPSDQRARALFDIADVRARLGDFQGAREAALPIAKGLEGGPDNLRWNSMWLMARVYHLRTWRRTAYRAYTEISATATSTHDQAVAQVEKTGLIMELSRCGSGNMGDCRISAAKTLLQFGHSGDPELQRRCATSALMGLESFCWESSREQAVRVLQDMEVLFDEANCERDLALAHLFGGEALNLLGRQSEAIPHFRWVVERYSDRDEIWPGSGLQHIPRAMYLLATDLKRVGTDEANAEARTVAIDLVRRFPTTEWSMSIREEARRGEEWSQGVPPATDDDLRALMARSVSPERDVAPPSGQ